MIGHLRRWRWFYATIVVGHLAGETFPFSHWPMYASFGPKASYVYVADASGTPLPHQQVFGNSSAFLSKRFRSEAARAAAEMTAAQAPPSRADAERRGGVQLLTRLAAPLPAARQRQLGGLRLVEVVIRDENRSLVRSERTVAEITLPPAPGDAAP